MHDVFVYCAISVSNRNAAYVPIRKIVFYVIRQPDWQTHTARWWCSKAKVCSCFSTMRVFGCIRHTLLIESALSSTPQIRFTGFFVEVDQSNRRPWQWFDYPRKLLIFRRNRLRFCITTTSRHQSIVIHQWDHINQIPTATRLFTTNGEPIRTKINCARGLSSRYQHALARVP